jgi:YD repeat-containing protein
MCADLDHLVYLPRGDTALTRRARKYSALSAVVVRFSTARKRYERQGVMVEEAALDRAEEECHADAADRLIKREEASRRRLEQDRDLAARMTEAILTLYPVCPPAEARAIAAHTSRRGSGRVGRTAAGQALETEALNAAVIASVRHRHTRYDQLLMHGYSRRDARDAVHEAINHVLERWRSDS